MAPKRRKESPAIVAPKAADKKRKIEQVGSSSGNPPANSAVTSSPVVAKRKKTPKPSPKAKSSPKPAPTKVVVAAPPATSKAAASSRAAGAKAPVAAKTSKADKDPPAPAGKKGGSRKASTKSEDAAPATKKTVAAAQVEKKSPDTTNHKAGAASKSAKAAASKATTAKAKAAKDAKSSKNTAASKSKKASASKAPPKKVKKPAAKGKAAKTKPPKPAAKKAAPKKASKKNAEAMWGNWGTNGGWGGGWGTGGAGAPNANQQSGGGQHPPAANNANDKPDTNSWQSNGSSSWQHGGDNNTWNGGAAPWGAAGGASSYSNTPGVIPKGKDPFFGAGGAFAPFGGAFGGMGFEAPASGTGMGFVLDGGGGPPPGKGKSSSSKGKSSSSKSGFSSKDGLWGMKGKGKDKAGKNFGAFGGDAFFGTGGKGGVDAATQKMKDKAAAELKESVKKVLKESMKESMKSAKASKASSSAAGTADHGKNPDAAAGTTSSNGGTNTSGGGGPSDPDAESLRLIQMMMGGGGPGVGGRQTWSQLLLDLKDPIKQSVALSDLCDQLSYSNEDQVAGFPLEGMIPALIRVVDSDDSNKGVTACRCLRTIVDLIPPTAAKHVCSKQGLPVLIGKLLEIQYIDLAEEVVYTVDRIADDCPLAVLRSGGLAAILQFLDFFSNSVQRKCITAASKILGPWKATELDGKLDEKSLFESFVQPAIPLLSMYLTHHDDQISTITSACWRKVVELVPPSLLDETFPANLLLDFLLLLKKSNYANADVLYILSVLAHHSVGVTKVLFSLEIVTYIREAIDVAPLATISLLCSL